jgi:hypothetical protein
MQVQLHSIGSQSRTGTQGHQPSQDQGRKFFMETLLVIQDKSSLETL